MAEFKSNLGIPDKSGLEKAKSAVTPSETEAAKRRHARFNFIFYLEKSEQKLQSDSHDKRMQNLRKELTELKSTEWQYDPIDKYIGQS